MIELTIILIALVVTVVVQMFILGYMISLFNLLYINVGYDDERKM